MSATIENFEVIKKEVSPVLAHAAQLIVRDQTTRDEAIDFGKQIKGGQRRVDAFFDPTIESAHKTWKSALAQKAQFTDALKAAEAAVKQKILAFDREQEEIRLKEQRRLQAESDECARKEREKAQLEAARQRAFEEENRRRAEETRQAAEKASAEEKIRLQKEAEKLERKANAAQAKAQLQQEAAESVIAPVVTVEPMVEKGKGEATRTIWKARVTDVSLIPREYMIPNQAALNQVARATQGILAIPGVEFYCESTLVLSAQ